jgi:hypothetical protein
MGQFIQLALAGADFAVKRAQWKPEMSIWKKWASTFLGIGGLTSSNTSMANFSVAGQIKFRRFYSFGDCESGFGTYFHSL